MMKDMIDAFETRRFWDAMGYWTGLDWVHLSPFRFFWGFCGGGVWSTCST